MAAVLKKHPVVVSRWVSESGRMKREDLDFAAQLESLGQALSTNAIERLGEFWTPEQECQEGFSWHRFTVSGLLPGTRATIHNADYGTELDQPDVFPDSKPSLKMWVGSSSTAEIHRSVSAVV